MDAIVLVGGMGTRLKSVVQEVPKPMAPVAGHPFLEYLIEYLYQWQFTRVILATGFQHAQIETYFGGRYKDIQLLYSQENTPLGTGGAIKKALSIINGEHVAVLNGDTLFTIPFDQLYQEFLLADADLVLSLKSMKEFDRYGTVKCLGKRVIQFEEKQYCRRGLINGGVSIMRTNLLHKVVMPEIFSWENDFLHAYTQHLNFQASIFENYFIDIGIPEDYHRAQTEIPKVLGWKLHD